MAWYAGKTALITGGTSGIGLGIARQFIRNGANVMVAGACPSREGDEIARSLGPKAAFKSCEVANWESQHDVFTSTLNTFGPRLDYVIANAGVSDIQAMREKDSDNFSTSYLSLEQIKDNPPSLRVLDVNMKGVAYSAYLALAQFRSQEPDKAGWRGKLVMTGSNASLYPFPVDALYGASKMGVLGLTRALGPKVLDEGITVNCFGPLVVRTGLADPSFFDDLQKRGLLTPMETIHRCMDMFLNPQSRLTGQIAENCGERNILRLGHSYPPGITEPTLDLFYSVEEIREALKTDGYDVL